VCSSTREPSSCRVPISINAHAEELRSKFVAHEGQKELTVTAGGGRYSVDFGKIAQAMGDLLKDNVRTHKSWVFGIKYN
jgi:Domain of unknown function (DUF4419)